MSYIPPSTPPTPKCPWCGREGFTNWAECKIHVKRCSMSPRPRGASR